MHTDDVAWHHPFFGWTELLADGVLRPARDGLAVSYRPPAWDERGRLGAIEVPAGTHWLVVEGVGAGRRELAGLLDAILWVQTDVEAAEQRGCRSGPTAVRDPRVHEAIVTTAVRTRHPDQQA